MCKLRGHPFVDPGRPGFAGLVRKVCTCWAFFSVSPFAPEGFFGSQSIFEMPLNGFGLGGPSNLEGCVESAVWSNPGLFSLPPPGLCKLSVGCIWG